MFDPHIYAYQPLMSGSASNPTIQTITGDGQQLAKNGQSPVGSPQKSKHLNSNTVIPIQSTGGTAANATPQRKISRPDDDGSLRDIVVVNESAGNADIITTTHLTQDSQRRSDGSGSNSGENSRKTSTISSHTSSEITPDNTVVLTPKLEQTFPPLTVTPTTSLDQNQPKSSPVRKMSRFSVSPVVTETANNEIVVQENSVAAPTPQPEMQQQQQQQAPIEMNINEESYQRIEPPQSEFELQPQQSIGFRMPETLEQLKIELENITHAHVKSRDILSSGHSSLVQMPVNQEAELQDDTSHQDQETQAESLAECPSIDAAVGSMTGDNTSVYNSRRTSADMITGGTDITSTASGAMDYEDNLVSEPISMAPDDVGQKVPPPATVIER